MFELLRSPWEDRFNALVGRAESSLVIASPYVGRAPCNSILRAQAARTQYLDLLVVTDLSRRTLLSGGTDVHALADLAESFPASEVRFLPSVHAKVYVADEAEAIVTSGNMTQAGLSRNFEYGVSITSPDAVAAVKDDVLAYAGMGARVDKAELRYLAGLSDDLLALRRQAESALKGRVRAELQDRLDRMEDSIFELRTSGRTAHAIFAETILYLLRRGPMATRELHARIQAIHPDLCDDSVDRVIDGAHFGKKWKHAVRTAQQHLKRRGDVVLQDGLWRLAGQPSSRRT